MSTPTGPSRICMRVLQHCVKQPRITLKSIFSSEITEGKCMHLPFGRTKSRSFVVVWYRRSHRLSFLSTESEQYPYRVGGPQHTCSVSPSLVRFSSGTLGIPFRSRVAQRVWSVLARPKGGVNIVCSKSQKPGTRLFIDARTRLLELHI